MLGVNKKIKGTILGLPNETQAIHKTKIYSPETETKKSEKSTN
jgi:hypothetical protein